MIEHGCEIGKRERSHLAHTQLHLGFRCTGIERGTIILLPPIDERDDIADILILKLTLESRHGRALNAVLDPVDEIGIVMYLGVRLGEIDRWWIQRFRQRTVSTQPNPVATGAVGHVGFLTALHHHQIVGVDRSFPTLHHQQRIDLSLQDHDGCESDRDERETASFLSQRTLAGNRRGGDTHRSDGCQNQTSDASKILELQRCSRKLNRGVFFAKILGEGRGGWFEPGLLDAHRNLPITNQAEFGAVMLKGIALHAVQLYLLGTDLGIIRAGELGIHLGFGLQIRSRCFQTPVVHTGTARRHQEDSGATIEQHILTGLHGSLGELGSSRREHIHRAGGQQCAGKHDGKRHRQQ